MADSITDNRTNVTTAESTTNWTDLTGTGSTATVDNEVFIEGSNSLGEYSTNSDFGQMYNFGATDVSNNVFYIWIYCTVVSFLDSKATGGFRIRFAGSTIGDFFEVYVAGNDEWPTAIEGGWTQFVVDIEEAHANSDNTGGTKPATSSVERVGWASNCTSMPRMVDNTWVDQIARLPAGSPGIIVQGQNGGTVDWDSADIFTELGNAAGTFLPAPGGAWKINTPIQFGIDDTEDHGFADTNTTWLWDEQEFVADGFYGLSAIGNSGGTTNVDFGVKTGTGDDATGAQGASIQSAATGPRWFMDFDDPDLDAINLYGCSFQHGGDFLLNDPAVSVISSLYIDCTSALVSNSEQLRNKIINADTADGVAFMTTDDLTDVVFCEFFFSDGHGIELTTPNTSSQISKGNLFTGYAAQGGTANDRMVYNNSGAGLVTISIQEQGTFITYRNGTSATTDVVNSVNITLQDVVLGSQCAVYEAGTDTELMNEAATGGDVVEAYAFSSEQAVDINVRKSSIKPRFRSLTTASVDSDTALTLDAPEGLADDDIILVGIMSAAVGEADPTTVPSGFTELGNISDSGPSGTMWWYWKRAATEGASWEWDGYATTTAIAGVAVAIQGIDDTTAIDDSDFTSNANPSTNSITSTVNNVLLVSISMWDGATGQVGSSDDHDQEQLDIQLSTSFIGLLVHTSVNVGAAGVHTREVASTYGNDIGHGLIALRPDGVAAQRYRPWEGSGTITADGLTVSVSQIPDLIAT